jgi:hypothetical protein
MNMPPFKYLIRLPFANRLAGPELLGAKFVDTLDALTKIDPNLFRNWKVIDMSAMRSFPLAAVRPRIAEIIAHNVGPDDVDKSNPRFGYFAAGHNAVDPESHVMSIHVESGGVQPGNVWLQAGNEVVAPDPAIATYPLFRAALLAINAIWQQRWACVQVHRLNYDKAPLYPGASLFPYSQFHIPWIAYLGPSPLPNTIPPADIKTEPTSDGGLLVTAIEDRLDPTNPEHLRRARILAEILIARTGYKLR